MDKERLEYFRTRLLEEREATMSNLKSIEEGEIGIREDLDSESSSYDDYHPGSIASDLYMGEHTEDLRESLEDKLREIDESLEDIENEEYGYCSNCENIIDEESLEIIPYIKTCSDCSDELEDD